MWLPNKAFELFEVSKDSVGSMREELSAIRTENAMLKSQLLTTEANFKWLTTRVNALEVERAQLIQRAYNIAVPVPEIVRPAANPLELNSALFEDLGDKLAREMGLPVYTS